MLAKNETRSRNDVSEDGSARSRVATPTLASDIGEPGSGFDHSVAIVDSRFLNRECIAQSLRNCDIGLEIVPLNAMEEWQAAADSHPSLGAIVLSIGDKLLTHETSEEIRELVSTFNPVPVLLLADSEDLEQIVLALECGVRGYIPSSVGIAICAEAIRLAMVGGRFVPPSSIMAMSNHMKKKSQHARPLSSMFTQRQVEVVEALRKGKPNKIIAYELEMRESTVKVHIRNIMKKVKATNRTEVAYKINDMFPENA